MATFQKTFAQLTAVGNSAAFNCGDSNDHTFIIKVAAINTSVDYNFQGSHDGANWADLGSDIQKTANGTYIHSFAGVHVSMVRVAFKAEVGGAAVTLDVTYKGGE